MKLSAGIIITDGVNILLGHSTGNDFWDLPKGLSGKNESVLDTAIRETKEEFGLDYSSSPLIDCGEHGYTRNKRLHLFKVIVDEMPDVSFCECTSFFISISGRELPEIDGFGVFTITDGLNYVNKSMKRVIEKLI